MADAAAPPPRDKDKDLASIQEARLLARRARAAQAVLAEFSQEQIDAVVAAMAAIALAEAESLARLAVEETGYGNVPDKIQKNQFAAGRVHDHIRPQKTVGVIRRLDKERIIEIAEPFGVVAAIILSTNPTSTAIYNILIAVKARCAVVLSPHPAAVRCITRAAELMRDAGVRAGLPPDALLWMQTVTLEGTQELMRQREVAVILATGGMGLVRAAYSAGKPAYGVGPGNAPAYIERTADVAKAVRDVVTGKTFDNGVLCSSENSVVVDEAIADEARARFRELGGHFLSPDEAEAVARVLVTPQRLPNPALVGKSATYIAEKAGVRVPPETRVLIAPLEGVGRDYPLSVEKLCPVLSFYVVKDWREGCERCKAILRYGGMGHTMAIHSRDDDVILQFGLHKPAFRIVVNTPTSHGSIGLSTGLDPALTLGCGGFGGNITSDNIAPRHLLNIKRVAYEIAPAAPTRPALAAAAQTSAAPPGPRPMPFLAASPAPPAEPVTTGRLDRGIDATALRQRIDAFLVTRGYRPESGVAGATSSAARAPAPAAAPPAAEPLRPAPAVPVEEFDFVAEEDVRRAIARGVRIRLKARAIVTPAARDLAADHQVFVADGAAS